MGGGASKLIMGGGPPPSSTAIKEARMQSQQLQKELEAMEEEKKAKEEELKERLQDIENLGETMRQLQRSNDKLTQASEKAREEVEAADKSVKEMRAELDVVKKNATKMESEVRDLKGELTVTQEERSETQQEVDKIGGVLTQAMEEKAELEARITAAEQEREEMEQILRASAEMTDTYKDLSTKLMQKKTGGGGEGPALGPQDGDEAATVEGVEAPKAKAKVTSRVDQLGQLVPKVADRLKVTVVSTFEDFFMERNVFRGQLWAPLGEMCDRKGAALEVVDPWIGIKPSQEKDFGPTSVGLLRTYINEIETSDVVILLLGNRYGPDVPEEGAGVEAARRPWLQAHVEKTGRFGSMLEIIVARVMDLSLTDKIRVIALQREPGYELGLPEKIRARLKPEGGRAQRKLEQIKTSIQGKGLLHEEEYPHPEACAITLTEMLTKVFEGSFSKQQTALDVEASRHAFFLETSTWIGQGTKGKPLPDETEAYLDRVRKYVVGESSQPLAIVGNPGSGRTSFLQAAHLRLSKRFPEPDTVIMLHIAGVNAEGTDPMAWARRLCLRLALKLGLELPTPSKPSEIVSELGVWLDAAGATGTHIIVMIDGIDLMAASSSSERDPLAWLPRRLPPGVRFIVTLGAGPSLTAIAQRGAGAVTLQPLEEHQKGVLVDQYLSNRGSQPLESKARAKLLKGGRTSNPLLLVSCMHELQAIGVLDGTATAEPILFYMEADNLTMVMEKCLYRWESAYNGKLVGGSLVRDVLTCVYASRLGLRRSELLDMLQLSTAQVSPLLCEASSFFLAHCGLYTIPAEALRDAIRSRYVPTPDALVEAHRFVGDFFEESSTPLRQAQELPWQRAQSLDLEELIRIMSRADMFMMLQADENLRADVWSYYELLKQHDSHRSIATHIKASCTELDIRDPPPEIEYSAQAHTVMGQWLAEAGYLEAATSLLLRGLEQWGKTDTEEDDRAAACAESLAKVLGNMGAPEAEKYFEKASQLRARLAKTGFGMNEAFGRCMNDYGLWCKRNGRRDDATRHMIRAADIWSKVMGPEHPQVSTAYFNLSTVLYESGHLAQASEHANTAATIRKATAGPRHPLYAEALVNLGAVDLARSGGDQNGGGRMRREAIRMLQEGVGIYESSRGGQHPDTLWARSFLAQAGADIDDDDDDELENVQE